MNKVFNIMLIISLLIVSFVLPIEIQAKTLGEIKDELKELEKNLNKNEEEKQLTQSQIDNANRMIVQIKNSINQMNIDIVNLSKEIANLNKDIKQKQEEIKKIINFVQVSNGESAYLEYTFGAKTFTDFIYRMAISEQLAEYNKKLIKQYDLIIENNKKKTEQLKEKQKSLSEKQNQYAEQLKILGKKAKEISKESLSLEDEIKAKKEQIKAFESNGCKNNETLEACVGRQLISTNRLYRPIDYGYITSRFESRSYYLNGRLVHDFHYGIDMSRSGWSVPVYSAGIGVVGAILHKTSCGGNVVVIWHNINGVDYSTVYMHLRTINVKTSQVVTADTVIGTMGGSPSTETWDACSSGQHLHFAVATGHYLKTSAYNYSVFVSRTFDPAAIVNFPSGYGYFDNRTSIY